MASPPSKKDTFEELFSSAETLHVSLKRPASVLVSAPPFSMFSFPDEPMEDDDDPDDLPRMSDLSLAELKSGGERHEGCVELIKKAIMARSSVPRELLKDEALPDDLKLLCSEYNAVVEDMREEISQADQLGILARQGRRASVLFEMSLSFLANGILTATEMAQAPA